ncbi:hypothetical protein [Rhodobaculum claviforme]|uniref:Uncharacterized protein n=1 Tax=Rhodobaculum claviforme TaxID=1549854 RepID=A0A934TNC0_9RHOB|nr:hypothetical protein [Rhodobaculum claviforme]MBK5928883.1 hypothetical protein [Rhodobaculum claviforme]
MGHDWVFEVLTDMKSYARRHGFDDLAARLEETEHAARRDISRADGPGSDTGSDGGSDTGSDTGSDGGSPPPTGLPQRPARGG